MSPPTKDTEADVAVLGERIDGMRVELTEVKAVLSEIARALTKIVLIEERYQLLSADVHDLKQRVASVERQNLIESVQKRTMLKVGKIGWTVIASGGLFVAWQILNYFFSMAPR